MATLKLTSGIIKQSSFDKTGDGYKYNAIHFSKGAYTAAKPYQLNSGTTITADPGAIITLVAGASEKLFPAMTPVFGQVEKTIEDITIENITFDGNRSKQTVSHGKGYHNFVGLTNCSGIDIHNVTIQETQGDGARITDSSDISFSGNTVNKCGHDGLYVDRCSSVEAWNNTIYCRGNSALRSKGSSNVSFHDNFIFGTSEAYSPGIQVENSRADETSSDIQIVNNSISDTLGPGMWAAGHTATDTNSAAGLLVSGNLIKNCGNMPAGNGISGLGGIICDGWNNVTIENNTIDSCLGYGLFFGRYLTDSAGSGYTATVKNNTITNTKKCNFGSGGIALENAGKYILDVSENTVSGNVDNGLIVPPVISDPEEEPECIYVIIECENEEDAKAIAGKSKKAFVLKMV
jgi:hypothetical protein